MSESHLHKTAVHFACPGMAVVSCLQGCKIGLLCRQHLSSSLAHQQAPSRTQGPKQVFWDPSSAVVGGDGFVRVPARLLARYYELEHRFWSQASLQ